MLFRDPTVDGLKTGHTDAAAGSSAKVKTQVVEADPLVAPLTLGQPIGSLKITIADQALTEVPLVALGAVDSAGFVGCAWDAARLKMKL